MFLKKDSERLLKTELVGEIFCNTCENTFIK